MFSKKISTNGEQAGRVIKIFPSGVNLSAFQSVGWPFSKLDWGIMGQFLAGNKYSVSVHSDLFLQTNLCTNVKARNIGNSFSDTLPGLKAFFT